ncbi:MAG: tetratricopeptide repeat protein [Fibrobacter sp.]|nr:tetratricopeptide repeat protein [Fibrobacter sp.]
MRSRLIQVLSTIVLAVFVQVQAQSIESLMLSGQEMLQNGAFSQAVTQFRKVIQMEPSNFEAQFNLAFAYLGWGRNSNAVEEFKKAMRLQPRNSQVWANLAIAYENLGKSQDAINALYQAVQLDPQNITARMNLAAMYANANAHSKAVAQYKEVISLDGMNEEALTNLSKCLIALGKTDEAKGYLKQAIAANPNNGDAHWELGNIAWKKDNDREKAISEYKLAITVQPNGAHFYENLALALEDKGDKAGAIDVLKKSLIYTDDALKKEKIKEKIELLEKGDTANAKKADDSDTKLTTKSQINDLRKELGKGEKSSETQRINTAPIDVMGDLNDLNVDDGGSTLDLKSEAKKRAEKK